MGDSKIEWTDKTWSPVTGCTKISSGCKNCYAEKIAHRFAGMNGYPKDEPFRVTCHPDRLDQPLKWRKPSKIFVCSMGDLFHKDVSAYFQEQVIDICQESPKHIFMFLTKRPESMRDIFNVWSSNRDDLILPNVWLGVTAENQEQADKRIPILLQIPAAKRFVSIEPMLSPVDLRKHLHCGIDWCIIGSESGPNTRPMDENWVRSLICQCKENKVAVFYKQKKVNGKIIKMPEIDGRVYAEYPQTTDKPNVN